MYYMGQITVRDVDQEVFREFKADATKQGLTLGKALTLAMKTFHMKTSKTKKFSSLKPIYWGEGTEQVSENVDEILYGK
jgi:hypothetical protein